uniref:SCP domain-containing protein n=1 Tax=Ascaris lumbricoides TaxID=6252 RepID=A0A0M3IS79_ASCLU
MPTLILKDEKLQPAMIPIAIVSRASICAGNTHIGSRSAGKPANFAGRRLFRRLEEQIPQKRPTLEEKNGQPPYQNKKGQPLDRRVPRDQAGTATAVSCDNVHNQKFTPENRETVVNKHNELRSKLVKGNVRDARGERLESGRNIYELRWDCGLEEVAQRWADTCKYGHSTYEYRNQAGENIYMWIMDRHESIDTNTLKATQLWWDEIELINMTSPEDYKMNEKIIATAGHWSQVGHNFSN